MNPEYVRKMLVSVLETITHLQPGRVIWEGSGGPRPPEGLYCSLWWKGFDLLPQNDGAYLSSGPPESCPAAPFSQHLRHETWCTVQISFWGQGAFEAAVRAAQALQNHSRAFDLWRYLGYGGTDAVQDISAAFQGHLQGRAFFNLSFYACFHDGYPAGWFDHTRWAISHAETFNECEPSGRSDVPDCP